jgi:serine/threonine-protein kinase PknG
MACELYQSGLTALAADGSAANRGQVLGRPLSETPLRRGLEASYRQLARHASTAGERAELVDRANRARPRTLL